MNLSLLCLLQRIDFETFLFNVIERLVHQPSLGFKQNPL